MQKVKKEKAKFGVISNFIYAIKTINKIDKPYLYQKLVYVICGSITAFAYSYVIRLAVSLLEQKNGNISYQDMMLKILVAITFAFMINATTRVLNMVFVYKREKLQINMMHDLHIRTLDMDYELLERPETQDTLEKAGRLGGYGNGPVGLVEQGFYMIESIVSFLIGSVIVFTVNPWLVVVIAGLSIFKIFIENARRKNEKINFTDLTPKIWRRQGYINSISSNLTIAKDLRVYEMDQFIDQERQKTVNEFLPLFKDVKKKNILYEFMIKVLSVFDSLILYGFMIYEVLERGMLISTFTFMIASVTTLVRSLQWVISINGRVLKANLETIDYRTFMSMIETKKEEDRVILEVGKVEVEFKNVSYSYYMQEGYALEDICFKVKSGEKIALVGYNGAGKTTLVKLLTGLYHPTKGSILLNGVDIETLEKENLNQFISPVFQETIMYGFNVGENVAMKFGEDIDQEKISDILKLVELDKKIDSLPQKVKTMITREIDEKGIEFSGGESQRLSLARAIYKSAPIFVLDEPTSAMDAITESHIYQQFNQMIGDNSAIFISHRLSSTKFCDRIILLENGKIVEEGTHQELMTYESQYKKLFDMQAEYYKGGEEND